MIYKIFNLVRGCYFKIIRYFTSDKKNELPALVKAPEVTVKSAYKIYDCECKCKVCEENGFSCFEDMK